MLISWPAPIPEVRVTKFESSLISVDPQGLLDRMGWVRVTPRELRLIAVPRSQPTIHILTAEVPFTAEFSASVLDVRGGNVFPLQAKVWNPSTEVAVEAWYDDKGGIWVGVRQNDQWREKRSFGTYIVGGSNTWRIMWNETQAAFVVEQDGHDVSFSVRRHSASDLWEGGRVSLTVYSTSPGLATATVAVRNPVIGVPRQERYGTTTDSRLFKSIIIPASILGFLWLMVSIRRIQWIRVSGHEAGALLLILVASVGVGWWLGHIPGHPIDRHAVSLWSCLGRGGPQAIIPLSLLASGVADGGKQPYWSFVYSYPPLLTYIFWIIGRIARAGQEVQTLKMLSALFIGLGGGILMLLLRSVCTGLRQRLLVVSLYLLNPAILFDSAVWAQTESFVAFFLMLAAGGIIMQSGSLLWAGTFLAALSKQTGVLFAPVLIMLGLFRLGTARLLRGLPPAIIVTFLILAPLFLAGMHPAAVYRPIVVKAVEFGTVSGMEAINAVISQGSFTLWTVFSGLEGNRGLARLAFPDYVGSSLGISYFTLSRIVFSGFLLVLGGLIWRGRGLRPAGVTFLALASYGVAVGVLLTRVQPRYLYFGVMFTTAGLPWMSRLLGRAAVTALTGTMLTGMWAMYVFSSVWYPGTLEAFSPQRSWVNSAFAWAAASDVGITVGGLLSTGVLAILLASLGMITKPRNRGG